VVSATDSHGRNIGFLDPPLLSKNVKIKIHVYEILILHVVLCGCETCSLTLREEHRFRVFVNRVFRRIFRAKRDEVIGGWRKLNNEELRKLYSSPSIIRMIKSRTIKCAGHVTCMEE
jgi:hypothetical protein